MKFRKHTNSDIPEMERTYPKLGKYVAFLMAGILLLKAIPFEVLADELAVLSESTVSGGNVETEENVENTEDELETSSDELVTETLPDEALTNDEALTSDETAMEETPVEGLEDVPNEIVDNTESAESVITDTESVTEESIVANQTVSAGDAAILTEQSFEQEFSDAKVTVTGNLPEGIVCTIEEVELLTPYEELVAGTLSENMSYKIKKAYDINLYLNDEIYQPEEHGTYVTVSVEGLEESENGYVIHRIEDDSTVTDVTSETESTSVSFDAVHFTVYTVGETTIDTSTMNIVAGYPVTYLGLTCTLYDDGTMVVEGTQTADSSYYGCKSAPWYQNSAVTTIYADYDANGYAQKYMFRNCYCVNLQIGSNFNTSSVIDMNWMFDNCSKLTSLDLSNFDTSSVTDMSSMFYNCSSLTSLDLSNFNTSYVTDMSSMFYDCSSLTSLNLSNFDTSKVTNMSGMFNGCSKLKSITFGNNFNTSKVTDMSSMFGGLDGGVAAESLDLSMFDTSSVTNMSFMFCRCSNLESLDLSNFDISNVTNMYEMFGSGFGGCPKLKSVTFGNTYTASKITNVNSMFTYCTALEFVDISNFNLSAVEDVTNMFAFCNSLQELYTPYNNALEISLPATLYENGDANLPYSTIPVGLTASKYLKRMADTTWQNDYTYSIDSEKGYIILDTYNGTATELVVPGYAVIDGVTYQTKLSVRNHTTGSIWKNVKTTLTSLSFEEGVLLNTNSSCLFYQLSALTNLDINKVDTSNITNMGDMFRGCSALTSLDLSNFDTSKVTLMYDMFYGCSSLTSLDVSKLDTSNVTNMSWMFYNCSSLTSLNISNFNTSNVKYMYGMFDGCSSLTALNVSNFNTSNVTNMSWMFYGCSNLTSLDLSNFNTSNVTDMDSMFVSCSSLSSLDVSHFSTSNVTNMRWMFRDCSSLTSLDVSNFNTSNVTDMNDMFFACSGLTSLNVSNFNTSNVTDMSCMFKKCSSLTSLDLINFDTSNVTDMSGMFSQCNNLESITFGENFNTSKVTNMVEMFYECNNVTSLNVSNLDTSSVTSMYNMFYNCSSLTSLDLSNFNTSNVTNMSNMFYDCSNLSSLDVSNFNTSNVTNMSSMFEGCSSLTSLDLSNFDTSNVTNMSWMFYNCSSLTSLDLSTFKTSNVTNMMMMFCMCLNLTTLDISSFEINSGTEIENMFDALCYEQVYNMLIEMGLTEEICQEQMGMSMEAYIYNQIGLTSEDTLKLECIKTPKSCSVEIALPGTYYTHPDNTAYAALPINTTESITLYKNTFENGYMLSAPTLITLQDGQAQFEMNFVPEKDFESGASVVVTFDAAAKITTESSSIGITINKGTNSVTFTKEATVIITVEAEDIDNKQAGSYSGDLNFTIEKVPSAA